MNNKNILKKKKIDISDIMSVFLRSNFFQGSWNFKKMQSLGFCFSMIPIIKKLYPKNNEKRKKEIRKNLEFFNTNPYTASIILGITIALSEKKARGFKIKKNIINEVKTGLMAPLASIANPICWGTLRPLISSISANIAISGNIFGPIIFFIFFNFIRLSIRYYGIIYGYEYGIKLIKDINNKILGNIIEGSSILGVFIIGALVNRCINIKVEYIILDYLNPSGKHIITTMQSICDQIIPGLIPLLLMLTCTWLIKKKINTLIILIAVCLLGIIGSKTGFLILSK